MSDQLDVALLAAHADRDGAQLVALYKEAAAQAADETARGFFLTQAYVFALEVDHPDTWDLNACLVSMGREEPLPDP